MFANKISPFAYIPQDANAHSEGTHPHRGRGVPKYNKYLFTNKKNNIDASISLFHDFTLFD